MGFILSQTTSGKPDEICKYPAAYSGNGKVLKFRHSYLPLTTQNEDASTTFKLLKSYPIEECGIAALKIESCFYDVTNGSLLLAFVGTESGHIVPAHTNVLPEYNKLEGLKLSLITERGSCVQSHGSTVTGMRKLTTMIVLLQITF